MFAEFTSIALPLLSAATILLSGIAVARAHVLPRWEGLVSALLATYGIAAFILAIKSGTPYLQLFHGGSEPTPLPFWLQGAAVGTLFIARSRSFLGSSISEAPHAEGFPRESR